MQDIIHELKKRIQGEVRFDKISRILYSTDASIYEIEPVGVVIPKSSEDIQATVEIAAKNEIPIIPRGGGTSLVGQSIGAGIVLDCSKYLHRILEVNQEEKWARVQPGVVLDQINAHVKQWGLCFGPDTATSNRANLGGLIGNNSSGARSIFYGKTIDHVLELKVQLATGKEVVLKTLNTSELTGKIERSDFEGSIYKAVVEISHANKEEIDRRFPKILRRVGGYNLDEFVNGEEKFNLAKMIVGSEGTLGVVTEAKVNLVSLPKHRVLGVLHFSDLFSALDSVTPILDFQPSAIELLDQFIIRQTRTTLEYARRMTFVEGDPGAILLVEFQGDSKKRLMDSLNKLINFLKKHKLGTAHVAVIKPHEQENVWFIRKAGLGLMMGTKAARKPIGFIEDTAVPAEKLAAYIREFDAVIREHGTEACYYAHASVGCLHVRPLLNLKSKDDLARMQSLADHVSDLVLKYGGAFSGEHGDGLARSCFNEKMFGPKLYQAFKEIKRAFDPKNILNPGKIVDAQSLTENLRVIPQGKSQSLPTFLDFSKEGGFDAAIEICNGNGVCRKKDSGTMCPSYMVTSEEEHSTRGRANALRAVISGKLDKKEFTSKALYDVLDLCIACKGCKGECPTNVDMAKIKYEFLYHYHKENGLPLRDRLFGNIESLNRLGCALAPVSNWFVGAPPVRWLLDIFFGISNYRQLPHFAHQTFTDWFRQHKRSSSKRENKVVLFNDCFMTYNTPEVGIATTKLLEAAGYEVILPEKRCCGRPFLSKGMLDEAKTRAEFNVEKLFPLVEQGYKIVGVEPSCILTFRDEYPDMINDARVQTVAENTLLVDEFMLSENEQNNLNLNLKSAKSRFLLHGHCHMKALVGMNPTLSLLKMIPNAEIEVVDSGCCGMAGSFGFEKEHYEISMAMGRRKLFRAVESRNDDWQIVAPGVSCRQQIEHGTARKAKHPVEVLAEHLE